MPALSTLHSSTVSDGPPAPLPTPPPTIKELLGIPIIRALCASGCALCFIATAFDVVFVLFCYTPIQTGGLAFSVSIAVFCRCLALSYKQD